MRDYDNDHIKVFFLPLTLYSIEFHCIYHNMIVDMVNWISGLCVPLVTTTFIK